MSSKYPTSRLIAVDADRASVAESVRGEKNIPVPLTWISNLKWNGCSIPLGKKLPLGNVVFFSPKYSPKHQPSLPSWSVSILQDYFSIKWNHYRLSLEYNQRNVS